MKIFNKKSFITLVVICLFASSLPVTALNLSEKTLKSNSDFQMKTKEINLCFSEPQVVEFEDFSCVYVQEADFYHIADGEPVIPVKLNVFEFSFGTKITDISYEISCLKKLQINSNLSFGKISPRGTVQDGDIYNTTDLFPSEWISYHLGGGLSDTDHSTFLSLRTYPVRYSPENYELDYIDSITITIEYEEPKTSILPDNDVYDLLIISPLKFKNSLNKLTNHKNEQGVRTKLTTINQINSEGRDLQEQIKYYIHDAIVDWGIDYVLLVGGHKGQRPSWYLPVRYSHIVPPDEQEYAEESFISDIYYSDVFDYKGDFSSWDTNENSIFSEWNSDGKDQVDFYPDVYLGRLPCRYGFEVKIMVDKIINYEKQACDDSWFKNLLVVSGDSYPDAEGFNEGELISEEAISLMPDFSPERLYADEGQDIDRSDVNDILNSGCGFAYFCGHGNPLSWSTHYPPNGTGWTSGYTAFDMMFLKNKEKLPIVVVGGCHNAQFDTNLLKLITQGKESFYHSTWAPRCWAWWLTVKQGGGAIATIADTGLGTHGREDTDKNGIADYLEVLDGWLELNFLAEYGTYGNDILGENHVNTLTGYLHQFGGSGEKMDVKMIQQWILFGDPSLKIGGYVE